ncbi:MAG: O-antigen ligase family protein [Bryobacteraceae bacterium]|nr:O-antigen ligase family protein [Bryobacteraceae bacterium]
MAILAPVVLVLLPLLILPGTLFYYDVTPKAAVLLLGTAAGLICFDANASAMRMLLATRYGRWFAALLGCQLVSLILSTAASTNPALSAGGTNWRRYGLITQTALALFALMLAGHFSLNPRLVVRALRATAVVASVAAVYGILQYFGWDPLLPAESYQAGEGEFAIVRPPATFGHAAYFATYLLFGLFAAISLRQEDRWLSRLAIVLIPMAILLSGTRAALLGLLAGLVTLMALARPRLRTVALVAALALGGVAALLLTPAGKRLEARVHWSVDDARGGARLLLWRDSLRMGVSHWMVGTGLETFGNSFPAWESKELARQYPDFFHESPHNMFLDVLNAQGVPGLLVWVGLCVLPLLSIRREPALGAGWVAALVSLQFSSPTVATALGLLCLAAAMVRGQKNPAGFDSATRRRLTPGILAIGLAMTGLMLVMTDLHLQRVKSSLDAGRGEDAAAAYRQASRWALPGGNAGIYYSRRMAVLGRWPDALEAARRTVQTAEDRQNAFYNLAVIQAAVNDATGVESSLRAAIGNAPNWFKPRWTLAQILALQGRFDEAEREGAIAADLAGGRHPEVGEALSKIRQSKQLSRQAPPAR